MKIGIIGPAHPYRGGLAAYTERLAKEFLTQNHEVIIYTFSYQYPNILFPGKTQYSDEPTPKNLHIERKINSISPINWLRTGNEIKDKGFDLILINFWLPFMAPSLGTILGRIRKNNKTKIIAIIHNIIPHEARIGDKPFTKYFTNRVDGFLSMTQSVEDEISIFDQEKPRALSPHPIYDSFGDIEPKEDAQKKLGLDSSIRYMMFFGFVRDYKGLDLLLEAFLDDRFQEENIRLIIAGEYYTDRKKYQALLDHPKIKDKIHSFDKFIPDSEVAYYFNACELVVQPYKTATQSGVTQIAYHFNKPMIVTDVGGLAEMCPDGKVGYVVEPKADEVADAILKYFNTTDQDAMLKTLIKEKQKYSWSILTDSILGLYERIKK